MHIENFFVFFGSEKDNLRVNNHYDLEKIRRLQKKLSQQSGRNLDGLLFLKQTHSADVVVLNADNKSEFLSSHFQQPGDAIITAEKNMGIGVVTADCLPLVLYDTKNHAIGVIHAGWRGLSGKIISNTVRKMKKTFGTKSAELEVYFGPSAGVCCYEVQPDFLHHFPDTVFENKIIETRGGKFYFNECRAAFVELLENKVDAAAINFSKNNCTICQPGFCSARVQKENAGRQPTVCILF